jgi:hypothetical protein
MTTDQTPADLHKATSSDGRHFRIRVGNADSYRPGQFVSLDDSDGGVRLGQINQVEFDQQDGLTATGQVYATVDGAGRWSNRSAPFTSAAVGRADSELVEALNEGLHAGLEVGQLTTVPGARAALMSQRFSTTEVSEVLPRLRTANDPALMDLGLRIENLGILN